MIYVLFLILVVVVILALLAKAKAGPGGTSVGYPYVASRQLFSEAERKFLAVLDEAVDEQHRVFGKVRLADVATPRQGLSASIRQGAINRVGSKHFDFIICRRADLGIVCAVELNDRSHGSKRAQARDELVAKVCAAIGLPLLTIPAKASYSVPDVRLAITNAVSHAGADPRIGA